MGMLSTLLGAGLVRGSRAAVDALNAGDLSATQRAAIGAGALGGIGSALGGIYGAINPGHEDEKRLDDGTLQRKQKSRLLGALHGMGFGALSGGAAGAATGLLGKSASESNAQAGQQAPAKEPWSPEAQKGLRDLGIIAGTTAAHSLGGGLVGAGLGGLYGAINPGHDVVEENGKQTLKRRSRLQGAFNYGMPLGVVGGLYGASRGPGAAGNIIKKMDSPKTAFDLGAESVRR